VFAGVPFALQPWERARWQTDWHMRDFSWRSSSGLGLPHVPPDDLELTGCSTARPSTNGSPRCYERRENVIDAFSDLAALSEAGRVRAYLLSFSCICKMLLGVAVSTGDELMQVLATLANPHRMRVIAALARDRNYVSRLARELGISRALLQVHLRKLQAAGLVSAELELSDDGKAMKFYEVTPFSIQLTPEAIAAAVLTLSTPEIVQRGGEEEGPS
jgi:DNA-binding transcriptional ArsR family regulator